MEHPIRVKRAGGRHGGYRVLASRKRGSQAADAWAPQLAPSLGLLRSLRSGAALWEALLAAYEEELRGAAAQDVLKPLALLSRRKALTLLCDCPEDARCLHLVLARALEECRRAGCFVLTAPSPRPRSKSRTSRRRAT